MTSLLALVRTAQLTPAVERVPSDAGYLYRDEPERAVAADRLLELGYSEARIVRALAHPAEQYHRRKATQRRRDNAHLLRGLSPRMCDWIALVTGGRYVDALRPIWSCTRAALVRRSLISSKLNTHGGLNWYLTAAGWQVANALRDLRQAAQTQGLAHDGWVVP